MYREVLYTHYTYKEKVKAFRNIISGLGQQNLSSVNSHSHPMYLCMMYSTLSFGVRPIQRISVHACI